MNLTIIPSDGAIYVDGFAVSGLTFNYPPGVHALQWSNGAGWIEYTTGEPNAPIASLPAWASDAIATHAEAVAVLEAASVVIPPTPDEIESRRIESLWQAAHNYEYEQVSGSAIGMLAIGVIQSLPKCLAVQGWIKSIWTLYYERKAGASTDTDYTSAGNCPHSVPELMIELGL